MHLARRGFSTGQMLGKEMYQHPKKHSSSEQRCQVARQIGRAARPFGPCPMPRSSRHRGMENVSLVG